MVSSGMQKMVQRLVQGLKLAPGPERVLLLARTVPEMTAVAKYVDRVLRRAREFSRVVYEDGEQYLFTLSFFGSDVNADLCEVWVADIHDATPDVLNYFTDGGHAADMVAWPNEGGHYIVVPYAAWQETWYPGSADGYPRYPKHTFPFYRPINILSQHPDEVRLCMQFDVGKPLGWMPPAPKVSIWEHLRRNLSIDLREEGEEVRSMAAKKASKTKAKAKVKSKKSSKSAKKPASI